MNCSRVLPLMMLIGFSILLMGAAPLQRSNLPPETAYKDTAQDWSAQQTFWRPIRLYPGTAPVTPQGGMLYISSSDGKIRVYRNGSFHVLVTEADLRGAVMQASAGGVDVGAWTKLDITGPGVTVTLNGTTLNVSVSQGGGSVGGSVIPTGTVNAFAGSTAPEGWLLCRGQEVSRATYATLFGVIGTTYGAGNGSTTFNLPDIRGRVVAGKDNMGGVAANRLSNSGTGNPGIDGATLGASGGADRMTITTAQLPPHSHPLPYSISGLGIGDIHSAMDGGSAGSYDSSNRGDGEPHPNMPPTLVMQYIIKH